MVQFSINHSISGVKTRAHCKLLSLVRFCASIQRLSVSWQSIHKGGRAVPHLSRLKSVFLWVFCGAFAVAVARNTLAQNDTVENVMESTVAPMAASGKPSTRKEIQKHWQKLLNESLPLVTAQLRKSGSFFPFAAVQYGDGQIKVVTTQQTPPALSPESGLAALRRELATLTRNGRLLAVVYYADAAVTRKDTGLRQTGIRIKLDHASGDAMEGFLPYTREESGALNLLTPEYRPSTNVTFR